MLSLKMCKIIQSGAFLLLVLYGEGVLGRHHSSKSSKTSSEPEPLPAPTPSPVEVDSDGKIVGGYSTTIQNVPYQVYLLLKKGSDYYQCGGSIISSRYVLTAAHCLSGIEQVFVRIGSTDAQSGGTQYSTKSYKIHPQYNAKNSNFDVGVIKMEQNMKLDGTNAKVVKLPRENTSVNPGVELLVSGWGTTSENGDTSRNLMAVKVPTVSTADCKKSYGNSITNNMICAGAPEGGKDSCQGDSGGPAVNNEIQLGIVSFGIGCARKGTPGVYTKVSAVRTWIRTNAGV